MLLTEAVWNYAFLFWCWWQVLLEISIYGLHFYVVCRLNLWMWRAFMEGIEWDCGCVVYWVWEIEMHTFYIVHRLNLWLSWAFTGSIEWDYRCVVYKLKWTDLHQLCEMHNCAICVFKSFCKIVHHLLIYCVLIELN